MVNSDRSICLTLSLQLENQPTVLILKIKTQENFQKKIKTTKQAAYRTAYIHTVQFIEGYFEV